MQPGAIRKEQPWVTRFDFETLQISVKRVSFRDNFGITYHCPPTYEISRVSRPAEPAEETRNFWSSDNFFTAKTIDQLIAGQATFPIHDISVFAGAIPDEDMDEFVADIYRTRVG
jgi:hypothetical protein